MMNSYKSNVDSSNFTHPPSSKSIFLSFKEKGTCPRCELPAFAAESRIVNGYRFHETCFFCSVCKTGLSSLNLAAKDCEIFCNKCYGRTHGVRGYGYGLGAGALSMTMTSIKHKDFSQTVHNPKTNLGRLSENPYASNLKDLTQDDTMVDLSTGAIIHGRFVKATAHDCLKFANVPKTCEAYCFPQMVKDPLPSETLTSDKSDQMMQKRLKLASSAASSSGLPPNTIVAVPAFHNSVKYQ